MTTERCEHGQLKRSCERCEEAADIAALEWQIAHATSLLERWRNGWGWVAEKPNADVTEPPLGVAKKCGMCGFVGQEDPVIGCPRCKWDEMQSAESAQVSEKRWPFVETPGEFTERLEEAMHHFPLLGAVRNVLIENPPVIAAWAIEAAIDGGKVQACVAQSGAADAAKPHDEALGSFAAQIMAANAAATDELCAAFLSEYGCRPSECEIVRQTVGNEVCIFMRKRSDAGKGIEDTPVDPVSRQDAEFSARYPAKK